MANFIKYTAKQLENLLDQIYSGSITPKRLPVDLYSVILDRLNNAVDRGMGGTSFDVGSPDEILSQYYKHNIAVFSGAKTHQQVRDMSNFVFTPDGFKRDFSEFKVFANKIFDKYNNAWLRTEYDTAFRTAQMGKQWNQYVDDADIFPYLRYRTVHDERVRHDHAQFDGITLPVGDKFWNTHTPPNGFNCRCRLMQVSPDENPKITPKSVIDGLPRPDEPLFEFNPGKHGYIFDEKIHPYTAKIGERFKVDSETNFGLPTPPKPTIPLPKPKIPSVAMPKKVDQLTIETIKTESNAKEMIQKIANKSGLKIDQIDIDFNVIDIERAKKYISEMDRLFDKYEIPEFRRKRGVKKMIFKSNGKEYGSVTSSPDMIVEWNAGHQTDNWNVSRKRDLTSINLRGKSAVDEKNGMISSFTHEFAHLLSVHRGKQTNKFFPQTFSFWNEIESIQRKYKAKLKSFYKITDMDIRRIEVQKTYLGNYAGSNVNEFFAESFTEYELSSDPSPFAVEVGKLVEKTFGKK